jgi:D-hydroxyproline dehydrogenase subunit gamma
MPDAVTLSVNGRSITVPEGSMVSGAILSSGVVGFRRSAAGEARAPLCGMGICFECRVTIDGQAHARSCQIVCRNGMDVRTDE